MFGLFKKKTEKEKLLEKYKALTEEAYKLSHSNRVASDAKTKEANDILEQINKLEWNMNEKHRATTAFFF